MTDTPKASLDELPDLLRQKAVLRDEHLRLEDQRREVAHAIENNRVAQVNLSEKINQIVDNNVAAYMTRTEPDWRLGPNARSTPVMMMAPGKP